MFEEDLVVNLSEIWILLGNLQLFDVLKSEMNGQMLVTKHGLS
jgi:hypothetical protein